jgi:probable H4MPT-linked C1 transfer pathway protein
MMNFAGIDIGGANIKLAVLDGESKQIAFPIWKDKHQLTEVLTQIANSLAPDTRIGVTMTAELADCFATKRDGVDFIVQAVVESFPTQDPLFYRTDGMMCDAPTAINRWQSVAASNWHALARMAFSDPNDDSGFVLDIGSTTSDIIPVRDGSPVVGDHQNDFDRLGNGQLFYAGVGRTPVCSILQVVQLPGHRVTIAREMFATMADVFLWLGQLPDDEFTTETADGRPATRQYAGQRLARMVCADLDDMGSAIVDAIALQAKHALITQLSVCLNQVVSDHPALPLIFKTFGKGAWLVAEVIQLTFTDVRSEQIKIDSFSDNETTNQAAPALAVAKFRKELHSHSGVIHD